MSEQITRMLNNARQIAADPVSSKEKMAIMIDMLIGMVEVSQQQIEDLKELVKSTLQRAK